MSAPHSSAPNSTTTAARRWDIFCRVIDNFGDIGVCWRLSADLASRGEQVRLWVDDASALAWMAPQGAADVTVMPWPAEGTELEPSDVVIEAFGCELPSGIIQQMKRQTPPPRWINLEYLSAEDYVERCHGLPSPQLSGPGQGLVKQFFYPGFTAKTGGLLREQGLLERQQAFDAQAWRASLGLTSRAGERWISLFAYDNPALQELLPAMAASPTRLLVPPGPLASKAQQLLADATIYPQLKMHALPHVDQTQYDHLLWACDLNFVRGEDSFVRAQWAGRPFVWQIYPQEDAAHNAKLMAFLQRFLRSAEPKLCQSVTSLHRAWNGLSSPEPALIGALPAAQAWAAQCQNWRTHLLAQDDLCTQLMRFSSEQR
jgi:uncharacterized repeat protein (TIGR03837 family)